MKSPFHARSLFLKDQGLFKSHDIGVEGTKIIAVNSMDRSSSKQRLKKTMDDLDNMIDKYLREMDQNRAIEEDIDKGKIIRAIEKLREKGKILKGAMVKINSSGTYEISLTDPDASQIKTRHFVVLFNNDQISFDSDDHLITDYPLDNSAKDYASVAPLAKETTEFIDRLTFPQAGVISLCLICFHWQWKRQKHLSLFLNAEFREIEGFRKKITAGADSYTILLRTGM